MEGHVLHVLREELADGDDQLGIGLLVPRARRLPAAGALGRRLFAAAFGVDDGLRKRARVGEGLGAEHLPRQLARVRLRREVDRRHAAATSLVCFLAGRMCQNLLVNPAHAAALQRAVLFGGSLLWHRQSRRHIANRAPK